MSGRAGASANAPARGPGEHLVLVGLPGAGKSTVGPLLARRLGLPFVDLDREIERLAGLSVPRIFAERAEVAFRELERRATRALRGATPAVLAPGGGWIANPGAAATLRPPARIIHLRLSAEAALARLGTAVRERPLLAGPEPLEALRRLAAERGPLYHSMSDHVVDVELLDIQQVVRLCAELASAVGQG